MSPMELLCFVVSKMDDRNLGQSTAKPTSGGRPTEVGERETSTQREAHLKDEERGRKEGKNPDEII